MGIGPTGKQVTVSGLTLSRLEKGKVIEEYTNWDTFGMIYTSGAEAPASPNTRLATTMAVRIIDTNILGGR